MPQQTKRYIQATQPNRRKTRDRRIGDNRRSTLERRHDHRGTNRHKSVRFRLQSFRFWLRSVTKARLGVDRRKDDRRDYTDRRQSQLGSILSQEEISDLLS